MSGDRGMQPQRTALAWSRTSLALIVSALLVLRVGMQAHEALLIGWGAAMVGVAAAFYLAGARRKAALAAGLYQPASSLIAATSVAVALCAVGVVLSILKA